MHSHFSHTLLGGETHGWVPDSVHNTAFFSKSSLPRTVFTTVNEVAIVNVVAFLGDFLLKKKCCEDVAHLEFSIG